MLNFDIECAHTAYRPAHGIPEAQGCGNYFTMYLWPVVGTTHELHNLWYYIQSCTALSKTLISTLPQTLPTGFCRQQHQRTPNPRDNRLQSGKRWHTQPTQFEAPAALFLSATVPTFPPQTFKHVPVLYRVPAGFGQERCQCSPGSHLWQPSHPAKPGSSPSCTPSRPLRNGQDCHRCVTACGMVGYVRTAAAPFACPSHPFRG
jgi:hypothetical protein